MQQLDTTTEPGLNAALAGLVGEWGLKQVLTVLQRQSAQRATEEETAGNIGVAQGFGEAAAYVSMAAENIPQVLGAMPGTIRTLSAPARG